MCHPIVKTVDSSGCYSYLVGCRESGLALLIDPKVGDEATYEDLLARYGLKLGLVVDTHTHADHLSASTRYVERGVPLAMAQSTGVDRELRGLAEGDVIEVGKLRFEVRATPGHTADSIALVGHGSVFCGDSLFVGGLARADFRGSDPVQLFDSVQAKLMTLPDETVVFPGHGYNGILFTTIGTERASNPALQHASGAAYAAAIAVTEGAGNTPAVDATLTMNLERHPDLPDSPTNAAACCAAPTGKGEREAIAEVDCEDRRETVAELAAEGRWIDVREPWEFDQGHVPGVKSLPLSELAFHLDELRGHDPLTISCRSGGRSMNAAKTLNHLGVVEPVNLRGGLLRWQELGYPIDGEPID